MKNLDKTILTIAGVAALLTIIYLFIKTKYINGTTSIDGSTGRRNVECIGGHIAYNGIISNKAC